MPAFCKLVEYLDRAGWQVEIVFISRDEHSEAHRNQTFSGYQLPNVNIKVIPRGRGLPIRLGWLVAEFMLSVRILYTLMRARPDVAYFDRANINFAAVAKVLGRKVVVRLFGVADLPAYLATRRWGVFPRLRAWSFRASFDYVICSRDGSAGESFMQKHLKSSVPREILYNGAQVVSSARATVQGRRRCLRADYGLQDDAIILLSTGRVEPDRNLDALLQVAADLRDLADILVVIVGGGDEIDALESMAVDLRLQERVLFTGRIPHSQVYEVLEQADIYVSTCILRSLGNDVLEAMRAAKCIVALDTCPLTGRDAEFRHPDLRQCVRLVDRSSIQPSLRIQLRYLLQNRDQINVLGMRAQNWALRNVWTWEQRLHHEESILRKIVEGK